MNPRSWYLDEQRFAGPEHLDPDYVRTYEHKAGFNPADDIARLDVHLMGVPNEQPNRPIDRRQG